MKLKFYLAISILSFYSCKVSKTTTNVDYNKKAQELAHKFILTDGHVDLPYRLKIKNFKMVENGTNRNKTAINAGISDVL